MATKFYVPTATAKQLRSIPAPILILYTETGRDIPQTQRKKDQERDQTPHGRANVCIVCDVTAGRPFQSSPAHCNDSGEKLGERKSRHHYYT